MLIINSVLSSLLNNNKLLTLNKKNPLKNIELNDEVNDEVNM
jgi:hypothetical protein